MPVDWNTLTSAFPESAAAIWNHFALELIFPQELVSTDPVPAVLMVTLDPSGITSLLPSVSVPRLTVVLPVQLFAVLLMVRPLALLTARNSIPAEPPMAGADRRDRLALRGHQDRQR